MYISVEIVDKAILPIRQCQSSITVKIHNSFQVGDDATKSRKSKGSQWTYAAIY